jgi:AcrR family transcriptional regulator
LQIVVERGQSMLTMKALADRLGVTVAALYNHIANKAELLLLVQDVVMSRVDATGFSGLGDRSAADCAGEPRERLAEALRNWSVSYRQVFSEFPELVPLIATTPISGAPATRGMYETVATGLAVAGLPEERIVPVIVAFESFLFGSAMDVNAPASVFSSRPYESDAPVFAAAVDAFTSAVDKRCSAPTGGANPYADEPFGLGLDALIGATVALLP